MSRLVRARGFTLIELMIVVAILSVVAVLAVVSYGKYVRRAARSEVVAMLGEIRVKEEAYVTEYGSYYQATANESTFDPAATGFTPKTPNPSATTYWGPLGVKFPRPQLYCGYNTIAGAANTAPSGAVGAAMLGTPNTVWFYARAGCDFDNNGTISYFNIVYNNTIIQGF